MLLSEKPFLSIDDFDLEGKIIILRTCLNSPIDPRTKRMQDDTRIRASAETIREISKKGAKVVILAHQGRPGDKDFVTLEQHVEILSKILNKEVKYVDDIFGSHARSEIANAALGDIILLENVRFYSEEMLDRPPEEQAKTHLIQKLAPLADIFVNDAFPAAHRGNVSLMGFTEVLPSCGGRIMEKELKALGKVRESPEKPCIYVLGGAKLKDSLTITDYVLKKEIADKVLTAGAIGTLFLMGAGYDIGEPNIDLLKNLKGIELVDSAKELLEKYRGKIEYPIDFGCKKSNDRIELSINNLPVKFPILDIGQKTVEKYAKTIKEAKSIVLNGTAGVFEEDNFKEGTKGLFQAIADSDAYSVSGGGHTVAALSSLGLENSISYLSISGKAMIEFLTGQKLIAIEQLMKVKARIS